MDSQVTSASMRIKNDTNCACTYFGSSHEAVLRFIYHRALGHSPLWLRSWPAKFVKLLNDHVRILYLKLNLHCRLQYEVLRVKRWTWQGCGNYKVQHNFIYGVVNSALELARMRALLSRDLCFLATETKYLCMRKSRVLHNSKPWLVSLRIRAFYQRFLNVRVP